ncbi:type II toxin-antitoxin system VapC family toxin [Kovacikia minuta CCNUW1]|uniref:type II toxin-antitoxin system VapC family toxin n=1 Tax=Kovacikia minuta TaxID=2931930 RepID=UPI001CCAB7FF|nr:type II toxin-antitoxin system VapC family toxin [Kovacikia minuta]UBF26645.1 type II toxin-antitoxin system VapC family toxin [Kovacikia minuta CCNUW1]
MSLRKTYIDSGVLITAFRGSDEIALRAIQVLDDPDRAFISSEFVKLEVLPKAIHGKRQFEVDFYETFFNQVSYWAEPLDLLVETAFQQASTYGLAAVDALHVAAALIIGADELLTTEKLTKPIHRVTGIQVISITEITSP